MKTTAPRSCVVLSLALLLALAGCSAGEFGGVEPQLADDQPPLVDLTELGVEDTQGELMNYGMFSGSVPASVDHSNSMAAVRSQGSRGTCMAHAIAAGVEGYYGLTTHLSVEQVWHRLKLPVDFALGLRMKGMRLAPERYWPYNGSAKTGMKAASKWGVDKMVSVGCNATNLKRKLSERKNNNVVISIAWQRNAVKNGVFENPQISTIKGAWQKMSCIKSSKTCGGHAILFVGYENRKDSDGKTRTFFKFKNSWGGSWGDSGYGYMSSEYLRHFCWSGYLVEKGPTVTASSSSWQTGTGCGSGTLFGESYCSTACPCDSGEGDCDSDAQCKAGLQCVKGGGSQLGAPAGVDVCLPPKNQTPPMPQLKKTFGAVCQLNNECEGNVCVTGLAVGYCSKRCAQDSQCPDAYRCSGQVCQLRPEPKDEPKKNPTPKTPSEGSQVYASDCTDHAQCQSGLCVKDNASGRRFCSQFCAVTAPSSCPQRSQCQPVGQTAVCSPGPSVSLDAASIVGGCNVAGTNPSAGLWVMLALLGLAIRRRK